MSELYNQGLIDQIKAVQRTVNDTINSLNAYIQYGPEMSSGAKTTRINGIKTSCTGLGVSTTDWLGNDDPG